MPSDPLNFPVLTAGESLSFSVTWSEGATAAAATPVDLAGYDAAAQFRDGDGNVRLDLTSDPGGGITLNAGGADGVILFEADPADTAGIPPGDLAFDLKLTYPSGRVRYLVSGVLPVRAAVTA